MRTLVCGSRHWKDRDLVFRTLDEWHAIVGISEVIEGCAKGADSIAEDWARSRRVYLTHYPADWDGLGKQAGPLRNSRMLTDGKPQVVIAFHDDLFHSAGTGDMVKKAERAGVKVVLVNHEMAAE